MAPRRLAALTLLLTACTSMSVDPPDGAPDDVAADATSDAMGDNGAADVADLRDASDAGVTTDDGIDESAPMYCGSNAECDDHIACTVDVCTIGGTCSHTPNNAQCPPGQYCNPMTGCM